MNKEYAQSLGQRYGNHWFDRETMRFFDGRILDSTWTLMDRAWEDGSPVAVREVWRFVSSERFNDITPRLYTIREMHVDHGFHTMRVDTVGEFQGYRTRETALAHIRDGA